MSLSAVPCCAPPGWQIKILVTGGGLVQRGVQGTGVTVVTASRGLASAVGVGILRLRRTLGLFLTAILSVQWIRVASLFPLFIGFLLFPVMPVLLNMQGRRAWVAAWLRGRMMVFRFHFNQISFALYCNDINLFQTV